MEFSPEELKEITELLAKELTEDEKKKWAKLLRAKPMHVWHPKDDLVFLIGRNNDHG